MPNLSSPEVLIVAFIIVYFFGANKLKEIAKGIGESTREIKKFQKELEAKDENGSGTQQ